MKILITLVVIVLLAVAGILYFGSGDLAVASKKPGQPAPDTPKQDFVTLTNLLEQDMARIPTALDAPGVTPNNAFSVRSRLGAAAGTRPEYQTLVQACDLIIYADKEHAVRQMSDQQAESNALGNLLGQGKANQNATGAARSAIRTRAQADWDAYRQQTDAEVKRLLATLQNVKL